jgi:hypothetical protein
MNPKFPDITVKLIGEDGNAFSIVGRVVKALRKAGIPQKEIAAYLDEAKAGDYAHLLEVPWKP